MNLIKIGNVKLGSKPEVVLAVNDYSQELSKAYQNGVSIIEIRIDQFVQTDLAYVTDQLAKFKQLGLPLIATIRTAREEGKWSGSEDARKSLFVSILKHVDAIDIEASSDSISAEVSKACKAASKTLIVSSHDFGQTPSNQQLDTLVAKAKGLGADIVKIAGLAENKDDVVRLLEFVSDNKEQGLVGISMGPLGSISRLVGPLFGSLLTYTSLEPTHGQLSLTNLVDMSRKLYPAFNEELIVSRELMEQI